MKQNDLNYENFGVINQAEQRSFLLTALTLRGSITPIVFPRILMFVAYFVIFNFFKLQFSVPVLPITPFEYTGFALGILLLLRLNAGLDRWWEARKIWGKIVNQSRNLALIGYSYAKEKNDDTLVFLNYAAIWPFVMSSFLTHKAYNKKIKKVLEKSEYEDLEKAKHGPLFIAEKIIQVLKKLRFQGLDDFAYHHAERERALLIDAIGACERIANTPIPFVLAVKIRRFILLFLVFLPFAVNASGFYSVVISAIISYTLFSLDEIGVQLQSPFSSQSLSRLPIEQISEKIYENVLSIKK